MLCGPNAAVKCQTACATCQAAHSEFGGDGKTATASTTTLPNNQRTAKPQHTLTLQQRVYITLYAATTEQQKIWPCGQLALDRMCAAHHGMQTACNHALGSAMRQGEAW